MTDLAPAAANEPTPRAKVIAVPFLDGHIPCVEIDGDPRVLPKPISDLMDLNWPGQYTKLTSDPAACIEFISIQMPGDDQARKQMTITLETFTVWLARLQPSRVKPEARETVIAYQRRAGRVLREHFFGTRRIAEGDELAELERQTQLTAQAIGIAKRERAARVEAEAEVQHMAPMVEAYEQVVDARGLVSMAVFAQQSRIVRPNGALLGQNAAMAALREIGVLKNAPGSADHNTPYQQHAHRIEVRTERRGPVSVNVAYVRPEHTQYLAARINEHLWPGRERLPRPRLGQLRAIEGGS